MASTTFQILASVLLLVLIPAAMSLPVRKTIRRPKSVNIFSSPAATFYPNNLLRSKAYSNAHIASALYGPGAYQYHPMSGAGLGTGLASYSAGYQGMNTPYYNGFGGAYPGHAGSSYENYNKVGLGHSVSSRKRSYVSNNYGFPTLGGSYEHSTNIHGGVAAVYPGAYVPIGGAKYGKYGSYDHFGFGGHGTYEITPGYTKVTHTQMVPNTYPRVNKLAGYGK